MSDSESPDPAKVPAPLDSGAPAAGGDPVSSGESPTEDPEAAATSEVGATIDDEHARITERFKHHPDPPRWLLPVITVLLVSLVVTAQVGDALSPKLVVQHPLLLMAMNSRNRILILVTNQVAVTPFFVIGTLRLLLSDPLFYVLGFFYGERAVKWFARRYPGSSRYFYQFEHIFGRLANPLVFIAPNNPVCLLAGATGMRPLTFIALNLSGTIARLMLIRWLGWVFVEELDVILRFIDRYQNWLLIGTVLLVVITVVVQVARKKGDVVAVAELEHDIREGADEE